MDSDLQVQFDTGHVFNGWNLQNVWSKEDQDWLTYTENSPYFFPHLQTSLFANGTSRQLNRPAICQDVFWSSDGMSFVAIHDDYGIRQYLVPQVGGNGSQQQLVPFTRTFKNSAIASSQVHPKYSLYNGTSQFNVILIGSKELPLQLYSLENSNQLCLQNFSTTNVNSGNWETPYCIDWANENQFLVGSVRNKVSLFDLERNEAIWVSQAVKRKSASKSIVSCFDQQSNQDYAGSQDRVFGTYDNELYLMDHRMRDSKLLYRSQSGGGFIRLFKSVNGHYLFVVKRKSETIDVLDTRNSYCKVNRLKLPFKIGNQKHKACFSPTHGLTVGTDYGSIINWSSSLVEFGGIDRYNTSCIDEMLDISPESECKTPFDSSRINIVEQCPIKPDLFIISRSPDKMAEIPDKNAASGVSIVQLFTE